MLIREIHQPLAEKPKLLDQVREVIRRMHYSERTEQAYVDWIKRYNFFNNNRHPLEMAATEAEQFLNQLAAVRNVSAATQNQALSALVFLIAMCFLCVLCTFA